MNRTTAAWLAQLLERQSVVRGGRGLEPQTGLIRACSHGGGGPQVGEVPHLPVIKES